MAYIDEGGVYAPTSPDMRNPNVSAADMPSSVGPGGGLQPGDTAGLPGEGVYQESQANAEQAYQDALTSIEQRKTQAYLHYGLSTDGSLDPNNHYGLAQQNQYGYASGVAKENTDYAARQAQFSGSAARQGEDYQSALSKIGTASAREGEDYGTSLRNFDLSGSRGLQDYNDGLASLDRSTGRENEDYSTILSRLGLSTGRENQDYGNTMSDLLGSKNRLQSQSGLTGRYDASGNPVGLDMTPGANGAYQQMLGDQTRQLSSLDDASVSRRLGHSGVGNRGLSTAEGQAQNNRSDYKTQLLNSLVDEHTQEQRAGQSHGRALEDISNSGSDALLGHSRSLQDLMQQRTNLGTAYGRSSEDLVNARADTLSAHNRTLQDLATQQADSGTAYNRSLQDINTDQTSGLAAHNQALQDLGFNYNTSVQNMGLDLTDLKNGFDSEALGASSTRSASLIDARRQQLLALLLNGGG